LSLALIVILIALSQFKHSTLMMTATFVDVMLIDVATFLFFLKVNPGLVEKLGLAVALAMPVMVLLWRGRPFRARRGAPVAPRHRLARMPPLPRRARRAVVGGADRPRGRILPASIRLQIRAVGCRCGRRPDERRRVGGRSRDRGPVEPRDWRSVPPGPQAAAHRHGVR